MKKTLDAATIVNELRGQSAFFPKAKNDTTQEEVPPLASLPIQEMKEPARKNRDLTIPRKPENLKTGIPENNLSGNPEILKPRIPENLKAEKYSTQLPPGLIKRIKQHALEQDIKDYEVVQFALEAYLPRKK